MAGCVGWLAALIMNFASATFLAFRAIFPVLPHGFDKRFLVLETWGFLVPFIWGFSAKWLPIFLGLRALRPRHLLWAIGLNSAGVIAVLFGLNLLSSFLLLAAIVTAVYSLRLFEPAERAAKIKGVHRSFPMFVRLAYGWAIASVGLAIWASITAVSAGIGVHRDMR